jgi:hypothetical protein
MTAEEAVERRLDVPEQQELTEGRSSTTEIIEICTGIH